MFIKENQTKENYEANSSNIGYFNFSYKWILLFVMIVFIYYYYNYNKK